MLGIALSAVAEEMHVVIAAWDGLFLPPFGKIARSLGSVPLIFLERKIFQR
jgi:hypothetical protein